MIRRRSSLPYGRSSLHNSDKDRKARRAAAHNNTFPNRGNI